MIFFGAAKGVATVQGTLTSGLTGNRREIGTNGTRRSRSDESATGRSTRDTVSYHLTV